MKKLIYLLILIIIALMFVTNSEAYLTKANWVGGTIDTSNILLDAEGDNATFAVLLDTYTNDFPNSTAQVTVFNAACSRPSTCATKEIVKIKASSCTGTHPARVCTLTINARNQESTTHSGDWVAGSKVDLSATTGVFTEITDAVDSRVVGSSSSTDNAIVRYDGTTGKLVQDSAVTIADTTGAMSVNGAVTIYRPYIDAGCPYETVIFGDSGSYLQHDTGQDACYNTFLGEEAGYSTTTGHHNTLAGSDTAFHLTTGNYNSIYGSDSLGAATSASGNSILGFISGGVITTGSENTLIGHYVGSNITSGSNNIVIGNNLTVPSATADNQLNIGNSILGNLSTHVIDFPGSIRLLETGSSPTYYTTIQSGDLTGAGITLTTPTTAGTLALHNESTTGSAGSLSISGQTGLLTVTGLTSTNRAKTVRDANDTVLELGGGYTPTGIWDWSSATMTVPVNKGGTNKTSWTQYLIPYADTTTSFSQIAIGSATQVLTSNGAGAAPSFQVSPSKPAGQVFLSSAGGWTSTTSGCQTNTLYESTTYKVNTITLDFDASIIKYAEWTMAMPSDWDGGTITATFYWKANDATTQAVVWCLQGTSYGDGDNIDIAFGTAQCVTDANASTAFQVRKSAATSAITLAGTPAAGEVVQFRAYRNATDGADTLTVNAQLLGIMIGFSRSS